MGEGRGDRTGQRRRWKERHPEKLAEHKAAWRDRWRKANPEKKAAHAYVYRALRRGSLIRPDSCSLCGAGGPVEAHHEDYSKPHEVVWLCRPCHRKIKAPAPSLPPHSPPGGRSYARARRAPARARKNQA